MENNNEKITLSVDELKELLDKAFSYGALSHFTHHTEKTTCWSKVNKDMNDEVLSLISNLEKHSEQNK